MIPSVEDADEERYHLRHPNRLFRNRIHDTILLHNTRALNGL
jgi:hypothetical protein